MMVKNRLFIVLVLLCTQHAVYGQGEAPAPDPAAAPAPAPEEEDVSPAPVGSIPWFPNNTKLRVCTSEWTPAVRCVGLDPVYWSGYEIDLFKAMMPLMGWTYDMIEWRCLEWDEMMNLLVNTTECDIAPAGMGPWQERIDKGLRFSVATLQSGLVWSFVVFILMALYSANLTANLTVSQLNNSIRSVKDLPGRAVASWSGYEEDLRDKYKVQIVPYPWGDVADERKMAEDLVNGLVSAVVLDDSALRSLDADNCQTMIVGSQIDVFDQTVGFPRSTWQNAEFMDVFNIRMRQLLEAGEIENLQEEYIDVQLASCKTDNVEEKYTVVTWNEVSGLWVILGSAVGFGILLVIVYRLWLYAKPSLLEKAWFRTMFPFLIPKSRLHRSLKKMVSKGMSKKDRYLNDEDIYEQRYEGAPVGYVDGSSDIQDGFVQQHERDMMCEEGGVPRRASVRPRGLTFEQLVLAELANLKEQINEMASHNSTDSGSEPFKSHSIHL
ncbi:Glutamate receptor ionotropic, kainate 2 [Picochlorum sp. SENEW3]|nr:Glutamate receptor ionotropic, kainate 2 [Picochlorum sp. SENEW3]